MAPYSSCKWEHTQLKTEHEVAQWNFIPQHEVLKVSYSKDSHCIQVININTIYNQSVQDQSLHHTFFISWRQKKSDLWTISQNWALVAGSHPGWLSPRFKVEFCLLLLQSLLPSKPNNCNSLRSTSQELSKLIQSSIRYVGLFLCQTT